MSQHEQVIVGGGCFWCIEAILERLNGVLSVESGYSGGNTSNPDYRSVCSGTTGHAEVVRVTFDPDKIKYRDILSIFMQSHDPTSLNRQGADKGTQYRSIILYINEKQRIIAEEVLHDAQKQWKDKIVTELKALERFYPAEAGHQNYYNQNRNQGYCRIVIDPKIAQLRQKFGEQLKKEHDKN